MSVYDDEEKCDPPANHPSPAGGHDVGVPSQSVTPKGTPPYTLALLLLTVPYLMVEMGFSARLLDLSSGFPTEAEIHNVEVTGRLLSGFALALALVGAGVFPLAWKRNWKPWLWCVVSAVVITGAMWAAWHQERALIDNWADASKPETRRGALVLSMLSETVRRGDIGFQGIYLTPEERMSPEGKAFASLFAGLSLSVPGAEESARPNLRHTVRRAVENHVGHPVDMYNKVWIPSVQSIVDAFGRYQAGVQDHKRAMEQAEVMGEKAWGTLIQKLRSNGYRPDTVPQQWWPDVQRQAREMGAGVPDTWRPTDKAGLKAAIRGDIERQADEAWNRQIEASLGAGVKLPRTLEWSGFWSAPAVQAKWRQGLVDAGMGDIRGTLRPDTQVPQFVAQVYQPFLDRVAEREYQRLSSPVSTFADGGENAEIGKQGVRALLVPPVAMTFSLLGMLTHAAKVVVYLGKLLIGRRDGVGKLRLAPMLAAAALVGGLVLTIEASSNRVTSHTIWIDLQHAAAADPSIGPTKAHAARWLVQGETVFYPINEAIRRGLLLGYQFGYADKPAPSAPPAAPQ